MSKGVNKVILIGNLGADPESKYTPAGTAIVSIKLATSESWIDKATKEKVERTEWHMVTFFGKLAEVAGEYLKKGAKVYVEGKLQTDKWQDKDGNDRYTTKIIADNMQMLGGKPDGQAKQQAASEPEAKGFRSSVPMGQSDDLESDNLPF